jgi:hypothetical protein
MDRAAIRKTGTVRFVNFIEKAFIATAIFPP